MRSLLQLGRVAEAEERHASRYDRFGPNSDWLEANRDGADTAFLRSLTEDPLPSVEPLAEVGPAEAYLRMWEKAEARGAALRP